MSIELNIHREAVARVLDGEKGAHIGAFFDFDGTVISGYSVFSFLQEQMLDGLLYPNDVSAIVRAGANLKLGIASFEQLMGEAAAKLRGVPEQTLINCGEAAYKKRVARMVYPESRALIEAHRSMGHTVAIVSSASRYQVGPALHDLQVDHLMCTGFEVENRVFTGALSGEPCFGVGKVKAIDKLCDEHGLDVASSYFYSDSDDDLLALEHVGKPQVLNPNSNLRRVAERRGWPVRAFSSRGGLSLETVARNLLATSSFVPTALTGLAIWWLTGSQNEGRNFIISTFGALSTALMGLRLDVRGQDKLWQHRPAVVIFNHQSNVDAVVLLKLLRSDAAAVGKKELTEIPIVGSAFDFMGMIPIDRSNTEAAVKAIEPLAQYMKEERRNVVVAPEGTRSNGMIPGRFKKGAFRIAMQAGVPIVPVVIHNSIDAQPKGDLLVRPATIVIDVLDPIDVSEWTVDELDERIDGVRDTYLRVLGLEDDHPIARADTGAASTQGASVVSLRSKRTDGSR